MIHEITKIDLWFIDKLAILVEMEMEQKAPEKPGTDGKCLKGSKTHRIPGQRHRQTDRKRPRMRSKAMRHENGIRPPSRWLIPAPLSLRLDDAVLLLLHSAVRMRRTEPPAGRRFWFWAPVPSALDRALSLTSALCTAHGHSQEEGYETVIVNNNPETVSTDFDIADKLYFEPLTPEDVESIVDIEKPDGAVVQFGGQTAIKLTEALMKMGVPILRNRSRGRGRGRGQRAV